MNKPNKLCAVRSQMHSARHSANRARVSADRYRIERDEWKQKAERAQERIAELQRLHDGDELFALPFAILPDELAAFKRFSETAEDDGSYDVAKPIMQRLAEIGLVRRITQNIYEQTVFGMAVLYGFFDTKPVPPLTITKEMILSFHHALTDGDIGESDFLEIEKGLKAALACVDQQPGEVKPCQECDPSVGFVCEECASKANMPEDAARYRWLRGNCTFSQMPDEPSCTLEFCAIPAHHDFDFGVFEDDVDAAIDAQIKKVGA